MGQADKNAYENGFRLMRRLKPRPVYFRHLAKQTFRKNMPRKQQHASSVQWRGNPALPPKQLRHQSR